MQEFSVQFLGSGDAFGGGGRFNTCILVQTPSACFLLDCGASSLIAMKKFQVESDAIDYIFLTHLHVDHFGGVPALIHEAELLARRTKTLLVFGPPGLEQRVRTAMDVYYPGAVIRGKFPLRFTEWESDKPVSVGLLKVRAYPARHSPGTGPHILKVETGGKTLVYTGDTEWTDALIEAADGADLLICDCFTVKPGKNHLDYETLKARRAELRCRRLILTHMGDDMLARLPRVEFEWAEDGKRIVL